MFSIAKEFNGDYDKLYDRLKNEINNYGNEKAFIEHLNNTDFFNYYSSNEKNYFFWKYENYLRENEQPVAAPITYDTFFISDKRLKFSIEHIVPQNSKETTLKVITDALTYDEITEDFVATYLHSIGNLTIDPMSANASKGNADVEAKNSKYFKKAPFKTQNELEEFLINGIWTHKSIETRQAKLILFARKQWCELVKI